MWNPLRRAGTDILQCFRPYLYSYHHIFPPPVPSAPSRFWPGALLLRGWPPPGPRSPPERPDVVTSPLFSKGWGRLLYQAPDCVIHDGKNGTIAQGYNLL